MSTATVKQGSTSGNSQKTPEKPSGRRECAYRRCGETFEPSVPTQKYHSDTCRKREYEERQADRKAAWVASYVAGRIQAKLPDWTRTGIERYEEVVG